VALREATQFLEALFGGAPAAARIALWTKADKTTHYLASPQDAARLAVQAEGDVYVHASLAGRDLGPRKRITNLTSAGIPGVWADIDVNGGPEGKQNAAPDLETAVQLAGSLLEPTVMVASGYGLHAWWLLDDGPWAFGSTGEQHKASEVCAAWNRLLAAQARELGFTIDSTGDLARLMRIPGTANHKGDAAGMMPAQVKGHPVPVDEQDGPRHSWEAIADLAAGAPAATAATTSPGGVDTAGLHMRPDAQPPMDKHEVLRLNSDLYARTWDHTRVEKDCKSWSASEWDLSLASQWAQASWTDQEIADGLVAHRRLKYPASAEKALRVDYVARTIVKARTQLRRERQDESRQDALDDLAHVADTKGGDPESTFAAFNAIVGGPEVRELVQDGRDPQTATFALVMANGDQVRLGPAGHLLNQDRFAEALMVVTGHVLRKVKIHEWRDAIQALLVHRTVRESVDDTPEGTVLEWLRRYMHERVTGDPNEAGRAREPFEKEGRIYVFGASFGTFVRSALRVRITDPDVKDMLRHAGFERTQHGYQRENGSWTTASYYAAPQGVLE
jgi:hypothetical protein